MVEAFTASDRERGAGKVLPFMIRHQWFQPRADNS